MKFGFGNSDSNVKMAMMVLIITVLFVLMSPGVIWRIPENNIANSDGTANKINVFTHGVLFSIILVFFYETIQKIIYKN
jgi:hypothetical protein